MTVDAAGGRTLEEWRDSARSLLAARIPPSAVRWRDPYDAQEVLTSPPAPGIALSTDDTPIQPARPRLTIPRPFAAHAEHALCHRDSSRFDTLYRVLFRITYERRDLLADAADEDVHNLLVLVKAVTRDAHKMKAFVRFRRIQSTEGDHYIAWHRPDHRVLPVVAPFFARRFGAMRWTILTPLGSADWDGAALAYGPPASRRDAPADDALEDFWRTYYANIFNPARANPRAMQREMPVRYWGALPESDLIESLLRAAPTRVQGMILPGGSPATSAAAYLPGGPIVSLEQLRDAAGACRGCDLHCRATQTVFGEGPADAALMFVGEQPGDQEDREGRPFVGPAGDVLARALAQAGIAREHTYITNAVKHFKWEPDPNRGLRRIHSKPSAREVRACRAWLDHEVALVRPKVVVLLGATAGQSLLGAQYRVSTMRSRLLRETPLAPAVVVGTIHPSAILRTHDPGLQALEYAALVEDLRLAASVIR